MKRLWLLFVIGCGGSDGGPPRDDADLFTPPPEAGELVECTTGTYGGDPAVQCIATWSCHTYGNLTLACGSDIVPNEIACVCVRENEQPQVVGVPTSCVDLAVLTTFVREQCGWSWL
jgi:hypothetical protein